MHANRLEFSRPWKNILSILLIPSKTLPAIETSTSFLATKNTKIDRNNDLGGLTPAQAD